MTADDILHALIAVSDDCIWATELAFFAGMHRIDFYTLAPVASRQFRASAYEIKISRGDYRRDSEKKQRGALRWSDRFWYVTPPGLLTVADLPDWAGLQEWDGKRFRIIRRAPMRRKEAPDWLFVVSMLRNSGECRRDVQLMKTQLSFLQHRLDRWTRERETAQRIKIDRWLAKHGEAAE